MSAHRSRDVVEGELGPRYVSAFQVMTASGRNGTTEITRPMIDSSPLHGLLWGGRERGHLGVRTHTSCRSEQT